MVILNSKAESKCLWAPKFEQIRPQILGMNFNGEKNPQLSYELLQSTILRCTHFT